MGRDENVYSSFLLSVDTRGLIKIIHDIYYRFVSFCNIVSLECYIFCSEYIYDYIIQKIVMIIIKYQKHRMGEFEMSKEQHERVIS